MQGMAAVFVAVVAVAMVVVAVPILATVVVAVFCMAAFHAEEACTDAAALDFFVGGGAHVVNGQLQIEADASERVVAVQYHVFGVEVGHDVERIGRQGAVAAGGQGVAVKHHAFFQLGWKSAAR